MKNTPVIIGYYSDLILLVFMPAISLIAAITIAKTLPKQWFVFLTAVITHAHLVIVFFRSHGNSEIFKTYPKRFIWVPLVLLASCLVSTWVFVLLTFLGVWWDSWHSSLQTFGIARIYDLRNGMLNEKVRKLDLVLNLVIYLGPVLAGATFLDQINNSFFQILRIAPATVASYMVWITPQLNLFRMLVVFAGLFLGTICIFEYRRLLREGYQIHPFKLYLILTTGVCATLSWGFNSFGEAFLAMNMFHSVQYFAMIWWSEQKRISSRMFFVPKKMRGRVGLLVLLTFGMGYGVWVAAVNTEVVVRVAVVVAILHFWFDSFIWSVRTKQVV
jgi:hypothetical protein